MLTALLTGLAATAIGAVLGILARRTLDTLNYRLADEQDLPSPNQRWWIIWTSALSLGSITAWIAGTDTWPLAPVLLPLALTGPALAAIDLDVMRLPNRILGPVAAVTLAGLAVATGWRGDWTAASRGIAGAALAGGSLWVLRVATRGNVGLGDVKLAALVGLVTAAVALPAAWWTLLIASCSAYAWAKATGHTDPFPYGPWLLAGSWIAVLAHPPS